MDLSIDARSGDTLSQLPLLIDGLKARGIDYIGPIPQLSGLLGIYFYDPNGIRLEFACQPEDGEMPAVVACLTQTKAKARAELATLPGVSPQWIEERLSALPG